MEQITSCVGQSDWRIVIRAYIAMFDIWRPKNAIDGRYVWLPVRFTDKGFEIEWVDEWGLGVFGAN